MPVLTQRGRWRRPRSGGGGAMEYEAEYGKTEAEIAVRGTGEKVAYGSAEGQSKKVKGIALRKKQAIK